MKPRELAIFLVRKLTEEHFSDLQSDQVREIRAHMTDMEMVAQRRRDTIVGVTCIALFFPPLGILAARETISVILPGGTGALFAMLIVMYTIILLSFRHWNRTALASTEWAREKGVRAREIEFRK